MTATDDDLDLGRLPASPLTYAAWMAAAAEEYDRLLRLLGGLEPGQWQAPTDCGGWAVRDIAAHLAGAAAGTASPRELVRQARLARRVDGGDLVDRMNDLQVHERRALPPTALLDDLRASSTRGLAARRRFPSLVLALPLPFGPPLGTRPLGYLMGRIYTRDAWMHRIDLARATSVPLDLTAGHDGAIVADVVAEWAATHPTDFELELSGPAGGRWSRGAGGATARIRMDAVDFARTLSGRVQGEGMLAHRVPF